MRLGASWRWHAKQQVLSMSTGETGALQCRFSMGALAGAIAEVPVSRQHEQKQEAPSRVALTTHESGHALTQTMHCPSGDAPPPVPQAMRCPS